MQQNVTEEKAIHPFTVESTNPNIKVIKSWLDMQTFKSVLKAAM
jgi:hypothetical protein